MHQAEFKYIKNVDKSIATMYLYDEIGYDQSTYRGIDGYAFAWEMDWLIRNYPEIKKINVRINSPGGGVIDGFSIYSSINNINQNVKGVTVDTYIDGIAASTAGWIALAGKTIYMADFGMLMLHKPYMDTDENLSKKDKEILQMFANSIITIFEAKTGLSKDEINAMMEEETWLDSSQALEKGFVNKIISSSGQKVEKPAESGVENYWKAFKNKLSAPKKTTIINQSAMSIETQPTTKKKISLSNQMSSMLGVKNHAEAVLKIEDLQKENKAVTEENKTLKTQLEEARNKLKEQEKQKAVTLIENAISQKKITAEQKDTWMNLAEQNFENAKNALEAMAVPTTTTAPKLTDIINQKGQDAGKTAVEDQDTYMYWAKNKPKELARLEKEDPDKFQQLVNTLK